MRKKLDNVKIMDDEVIKCFMNTNTGKEETTQAERREVADQWCNGDYSHHRGVAEKHGLLPIALLIASLIDINHPMLNSGRGTCFNSIECATLILSVMYNGVTVAQPLNHSFHSQPVERMNK